MIAIAIIIATILKNIIAYVQEIPETMRKAAQTIKDTTTKISHNKLFQNIKESYKTAVLAVNIVTSMMGCTSHMKQPHTTNRNTQNSPGKQKLNNEYDRLYQSHTPRTCNNICN